MIMKLIMRVVATSLGRWLLGGAVALLLSAAMYKWHMFKEDLIHKGQQVCVQEINKQTVLDLQDALAEERLISAELLRIALLAEDENALARARLRESNARLDTLSMQMREQERTDEDYAAWSNAPLPAGVADRLRTFRAGSDSDSSNKDSN